MTTSTSGAGRSIRLIEEYNRIGPGLVLHVKHIPGPCCSFKSVLIGEGTRSLYSREGHSRDDSVKRLIDKIESSAKAAERKCHRIYRQEMAEQLKTFLESTRKYSPYKGGWYT